MKALILAAGTGTRLKPVTERMPKALIKIGDYPMLEIVIRRLAGAGIRSIVINLHHFSQQIKDFICSKEAFGLDISYSDETEEILDTGGAIKKASSFFAEDECFLVHNVDILTDLDYQELINFHKAHSTLATLVVKDRPTTRNLLVDRKGMLCGWEYPERNIRIVTRESMKGLSYTAFSGIYVLSSRIFEKLPQERVFGFMPWILEIAAANNIFTWDQTNTFWYEAGRPESVERAGNELGFDAEDATFIFRK